MMTIDIVNENNHLELILKGRLDSLTAGDLEQVITDSLTEETASLTLNMEALDFISSKGLRVLVSTYRKMNGRSMRLVSPNPSVKEVLRLSGLMKIFDVE